MNDIIFTDMTFTFYKYDIYILQNTIFYGYDKNDYI